MILDFKKNIENSKENDIRNDIRYYFFHNAYIF